MTNVVLVTLDQFRGDCLSAAGHPVVRTPHLDALAAQGTRFARHYSQAAPCSPGRAALYTGTYQMTNRVVANGTPLDHRFDNVARVARRHGLLPILFGYTDQSVDPRTVDPDDARLTTYEGVLPGFDVPPQVQGHPAPYTAWMEAWLQMLRDLGHDEPLTWMDALRTEHERPAEHGSSRFLTDAVVDWLGRVDQPFLLHVSHLRPHPPYSAAGRFATMYDPDTLADPISPVDEEHRLTLHRLAMAIVGSPTDPAEMRALLAQYYGMISDVDEQVGILLQALHDIGLADDTAVIVTADHGEQAGDHGLLEKLGFFESSYHIPCIVRMPGSEPGVVVDRFTENVDVLPTICDLVDAPIPRQCQGRSLVPFLTGDHPDSWRDEAHWEYDWRDLSIASGRASRRDPRLEMQNLAVVRTDDHAYVQFGDGSFVCFELAVDPTWRTTTEDPTVVLPLARRMLAWRAQNLDRTLTGALVGGGAVGDATGNGGAVLGEWPQPNFWAR